MHETSLNGFSRRSFLLRSLFAGFGVAAVPALGALTACSPTPTPDEPMLGLLGNLRSRARSGAAEATGLIVGQADRVSAEVVRQCGTSPEDTCTTSVDVVEIPAEAPTVADIRGQMAALLPQAADDDQASLLTGLFAGLSTVDDATAGAPAIDWAVADTPLGADGSSRRSHASRALADATARIHEAVWLTGRLLPVAGAASKTVTTVADRLRRIRDAAFEATGVPAAAGYTFPVNAPAPTDPSGVLTALLTAVHAVTVELRRAVPGLDAEDRATVAMWCAVAARCEAAIEDRQGVDPLSVIVRGE